MQRLFILVSLLFAGPALQAQDRLPETSIITAVPNMAHAAVWIAEQLDYFGEEGVHASVTAAKGGAPCLAALIGRSADFCALASDMMILARLKGAPLIAVQAHNRNLTLSVTVRKDIVEKAGLDRRSPLEARMKLLAGLDTIGVTSPGAVSYQIFRFLIGKVGGDPDRVRFAFLGGPQLPAALMNNMIEAYAQSPPSGETTEAAGRGYVLIPLARGEIPELTDYPYEVLATRRDMLEQRPRVVRAVCRAVSRGGALVRHHPRAARRALRAHQLFNAQRLDQPVFDLALDMIEAAIPPWGNMSEEGWQKVIDFGTASGVIDPEQHRISAREGELWTNQYVGAAPP